jgi:hypothetical protein
MSAPIRFLKERPGYAAIPSLGVTVKLTKAAEREIFDTVEYASGAQTAGAKKELFRDLDNKEKQHTNFGTQRKLPAGHEFFLARLGVHVHQANGNSMSTDSDIIKILHASLLTVDVNERLIAEGPAWLFQGGFGAVGNTTRNATGVVTNGVASAAAARQLLVVQPIIGEKDQINGNLTTPDRVWQTTSTMPSLDGECDVSVVGGGVLKKPINQ